MFHIIPPVALSDRLIQYVPILASGLSTSNPLRGVPYLKREESKLLSVMVNTAM